MISSPASLLTELLPQVSRSFYLTLRILPRAIRPQISLAYLLARATDTIADTELVPVERRLDVLRRLRDRIQGRSAELSLDTLTAAQGEPAERMLLERMEEALECLGNLSSKDQPLVRQVLDTITSGQELDLMRFGGAAAERLSALADDAALDDYTFRVAGCVGEFWTRMCVRHVFASPVSKPGLLVGHGCAESEAVAPARFEQLGVRFGQGLQFVNILRDLPRDLRQGRCYLPLDRLNDLGLEPSDLLDPANEERLRPLYNSLLNRAEDHLAAGWTYTNLIPVSCPRVRMACAWPILIGVRTLALLRVRNPLDPGRRHKVSRAAVRALLLRSVLFYPLPPLWRELWREAGGGNGGSGCPGDSAQASARPADPVASGSLD